jgi:hypothetical protein
MALSASVTAAIADYPLLNQHGHGDKRESGVDDDHYRRTPHKSM